jgi:hypothetical protein
LERSLKIFYSWQLDSLRLTNKDFIRDAIDIAVKNLNHEDTIEDATRDDIIPVVVDQDTQDVAGAPPIAEVILEKISNSDVLVADVTLCARGPGDRPHINSNVAIELGYSLGKHGFSRLLMVMNTINGDADKLPFDLKHRRWPVTYALGETATKEERQKVVSDLVARITPILRAFRTETLKAVIAPVVPTAHVEIPSTSDKGRFWKQGETLAMTEGRDARPFTCDRRSLLFVRCIPTQKRPEMTSLVCLEVAKRLSPLCEWRGAGARRNKWGAIQIDHDSPERIVEGAVQVFSNGELWGFNSDMLNRAELDANADIDLEWIPSIALRDSVYPGLSRMLAVAHERFGEEEFRLVIGASQLKDHRILYGNGVSKTVGPIHKEEIILERRVGPNDTAKNLWNEFVLLLCAEAGSMPIPNMMVS